MGIKKYLATVFDGMSKGLFASLIIGVIVEQIGIYANVPEIEAAGKVAKLFMGPCIGVGVAYVRSAKHFTLIAAAIAGAFGAGTVSMSGVVSAIHAGGAVPFTMAVGEPVGAFLAALAAIELAKLIEGRTKFDLLIIPAVVVAVGAAMGLFISPYIARLMSEVGIFINSATDYHPLPMGLVLGAVVGVILTLPISSAALCIAIHIDGLAAGAALAGCCAQMIGFAVMSFRENKVSGLISQGIGTSMLQFPNIIRKPVIWLPTIISSTVCGLLATMVFKMETTAVGAGMGTCGLVGQITTLSAMGTDISVFLKIGLLHFAIPAVLTLVISEFMRKQGLIKLGDLQL